MKTLFLNFIYYGCFEGTKNYGYFLFAIFSLQIQVRG